VVTCALRYGRWILLAVLAGSAGPRLVSAQDAQYWNIAYGTEAQLLGGVVIGSPVDIGTTYYDPGSLSLSTNKGLAIAGSAYQFSSISYVNGLGPKQNLGSSSVVGVPTLFAGEIHLHGHDRLAYSFLTRQRLDAQIQGRNLPIDSAIDSPQLSYGSASLILNQHMEEYWGGLTYSHPFNEHIGLGITPYIAVHSQTANFSGLAAALGTSGAGGVDLREADFSYTNWGLLAKVGLGIVYPNFTAGLVITTPRANLFGSGSVGRTLTTINQGVSGTGPTAPSIAIAYQQNLSSTINSPFAIGAGGTYSWGPAHTATTLYVSGEWFGSVDQYSILSPPPFTPATGGAPLTGTVDEQLKSVLNGGLGVKHLFGATIAGYASFRTDNSAVGAPDENNALLARWNLVHVTAGASWGLAGSEFVLGGDLAFGSYTESSTAGTTSSGIPIVPGGAKVGYTAATLIVGFRLAGASP
jgi:hypothetical protein